MIQTISPPEKIAVMAHPGIDGALDFANEVGNFLEKNGAKTRTGSLYEEAFRDAVRYQQFDLLVALGGDGTLLRAGHL